jgi:hypothetical protein
MAAIANLVTLTSSLLVHSKAGVQLSARLPAEPFGLRRLRAMGATEMYRSDPNSVQWGSTATWAQKRAGERDFLKGLLAEVVRRNERPIIAEVLK